MNFPQEIPIFLGTMGFSYKDWEGRFYPAEISSRNYLSYYSRVFNAVEIDSTFYGTPKMESVLRWAAATPDGFQFSLKAPRQITHDLGLIGARGLMEEFVQVVSTLQDKLGAILIQFPPSFTAAQAGLLQNFLTELPTGPRYSVEVRDRSWFAPEAEMAKLLGAHGVAWAATEYPGLPRRIHLTAGFVYIRWIGQHGTFEHHIEERIDRTAELGDWWRLLQEVLPQVDAVYGFFNNDYAGFAPGSANRFKDMAGIPRSTPPQQGRLF